MKYVIRGFLPVGCFLLGFAVAVCVSLTNGLKKDPVVPGAQPAGVNRNVLREPRTCSDHEDARQSPQEAAMDILERRSQTLVEDDPGWMEQDYLLSAETGRWAFERVCLRVEYVRKWMSVRGAQLAEVRAAMEVESVTMESQDKAWVELVEHCAYAYRYPDMSETAATTGGVFGSRAVHVMEMVFHDGAWRIRKDWYTDPFGEGYRVPAQGPIPLRMSPHGPVAAEEGGSVPADGIGKYDRGKAVEYAVAYAGVPALSESGRYNPGYKVYTFLGGDCANFVSQILFAGGMEQGHGWHYDGEGSLAWVKADGLIWFLISSQRGKLIFTGTFSAATNPTESHPQGAFALLEQGDVIGYQARGEICHMAVVVGTDALGYPLIASHTADRLYFPWDLGWDKGTVFWFIKITY